MFLMMKLVILSPSEGIECLSSAEVCLWVVISGGKITWTSRSLFVLYVFRDGDAFALFK